MKSVVRTARQAEQQQAAEPWGSICWLASRQLTGCPGLTVGRVVIRCGEHNPRHSHANCQEVLYLLTGRLEHAVGDAWVTLEAGDTLVMHRGVPHYARSVGAMDAEMIVVYDTGDRQFRKEPKDSPPAQ